MGAAEDKLDLPGWVLLAFEANRRGFRNTAAFRRFCRKNSIPVRKNGRMEIVCPAEVDAAVLKMLQPSNDPLRLAAEASVAKAIASRHN